MFKLRILRVIHLPVCIFIIFLFFFFIFTTYFFKPLDNNELLGNLNKSKKSYRKSSGFLFNTDDNFRTNQEVLVFFNNKRQQRTKQDSQGENNGEVIFPGLRIVHLDLKGAPPKVSYLIKLFPILAHFGANGLLIEYEDMFPFSTIHRIAARNSYTMKDINDILNSAKENHLEVIPLIQGLGHAEFVLKLREFKHLREVPSYPQAYCPSKNESLRVIEGIIDDVLTAHPNAKYLHIGCDEVYQLAKCQTCHQVMLTNNWSKNDIYKNHVKTLAEYVKRQYPNIEVLVWDDELRSWSMSELLESGLGDLVTPVVWYYKNDVSYKLSSTLWTTYSSVFKKVWVASAFKGASGSDATALNLDQF